MARPGSEAAPPVFPRAVREDPLGFFFLGLFLVTLGLTLLFFELGLLEVLEAIGTAFSSLGSILLLDALVRHRRPWTRHKTLPYAVMGSFFLALGVAFLLGPGRWWPLSLMALGLASAAYGALRSLRSRLKGAGGP